MMEDKPEVRTLIESIKKLGTKELYEFADLIGECAAKELVKEKYDHEKWTKSRERNVLVHNYAFNAGIEYPQGATQDTLVELVYGVAYKLQKENVHYTDKHEQEREELYEKVYLMDGKNETVNAIHNTIKEFEKKIRNLESDMKKHFDT